MLRVLNGFFTHLWQVTLGVVVVGCAGMPAGAADANLAKARDAASVGAEVFGRACASCHGERGEGRATGPGVIGGGALRVFPRPASATGGQFTDVTQQQRLSKEQLPGGSRPPFHTADDLHKYVSSRMPQPQKRAGSLKADEYWAVVNFILIAHGSDVPSGGVNAANATSVPIEPR